MERHERPINALTRIDQSMINRVPKQVASTAYLVLANARYEFTQEVVQLASFDVPIACVGM